MRILYLCGDQGIPVFGRKGASTHIREMIAAWRRQGHEVSLAAPDLSGDRRPEEDFPLCALPRPTSRLLGSDGRYLLANWNARAVLLEHATRWKPDAIYERSALYFTAGEWLARRLRLPRLMEMNALLAEEQGGRLHFPAVARRVETGLARRADGIAAISVVMRAHLAELGADPEKIRPFGMAVDPRRFAPPQGPSPRRAALGWNNDEVVLGYVGSMNSYHQPAWYVDLAEKLLRRDESARVRFLIVGGSENKVQRFRSRLQPWIESGRVHFAGSVPQEQMVEWMTAMDAILIPGASPQSTPTKIFEAGALGRVMLLPATVPIRELCRHGSEALLFEQDDFGAFERAVRSFLNDPAPAQRAAEALRQHVLAEHTWDGHAERLAAWLQQLRLPH